MVLLQGLPLYDIFSLVIVVGFENSVNQWCPIPLLGNFTYAHNDGTTTTCNGNSGLSVCPTWTTMKFDYSKCSTVQAFSSTIFLYFILREILLLKIND